MFAAASYYEEITVPTVDEFYQDPSSVRRAMLACMSVLHVIDHVFHNRTSDPNAANSHIRTECEALSNQDELFAAVRGFANASKHAVLTSRLNAGFGSADYLRPVGGGLSYGMETSNSVLSDTSGAVMVKWKERNINLQVAIDHVMNRFVKDYSELNSCVVPIVP